MSTRLKNNQEIIGPLTHVETLDNGHLRITFSMLKQIELPISAISEKKLTSLVGKRVGILNMGGEFFVRTIKGK